MSDTVPEQPDSNPQQPANPYLQKPVNPPQQQPGQQPHMQQQPYPAYQQPAGNPYQQQPGQQGWPQAQQPPMQQQPYTQQHGQPGYPQQYGQQPYGYPGAVPKSRVAAGLFGILLGGLGVHRFYLGYTAIGILQIVVTVLTGGIGGLWGLIEGIMIIAGSSTFRTDARGVPLKE
ncbi:NINE protein [Paeniglutamicibacter sp. R2-26]|uniref:NINE protein n=1 Tax=Paeniglutamicibacter sp. R2-26 TaxID=3144417 RepID=UPI003EE455AC